MKDLKQRSREDDSKTVDVEGDEVVDNVFEETVEEEAIIVEETVEEEPVIAVEKTRPAFRAALRMFSNSSTGGGESYEAWKASRQGLVDRKRKKEQEDVMPSQNNITAGRLSNTTAGRQKSLRLSLSSSDNLEKCNSKTNIFTCSSAKGVRGDTGGAGETVQEGEQGLLGGNKEVTSGKCMRQRAWLGDKINSDRK